MGPIRFTVGGGRLYAPSLKRAAPNDGTDTTVLPAETVSSAVTHPSSGGIVGPGSSVAGTAVHITVHATSGAMAGSGSALAGSALRVAIHAASGALAGQGSAIVGTAACIRIHATSGAITGLSSVIAASAARLGDEDPRSQTARMRFLAYPAPFGMQVARSRKK